MSIKLNEIISKPAFSFEDLFDREVQIHKFEIDCDKLTYPTTIKNMLISIHK